MTPDRYEAQHENGTTWQLVAKPAMAANFARNYCRKNRMPGKVTLTDTATGEFNIVSVSKDYTI